MVRVSGAAALEKVRERLAVGRVGERVAQFGGDGDDAIPALGLTDDAAQTRSRGR